MRLTTSERRANPRRQISRPCKIKIGASGKFVGGTTCDVSSGGAMIVLDRRANLSPGDQVEIGVAWDNAAVIRAEEMSLGRVVRVVARDESTEGVAIALGASQRAALAA